MLLPAGAAATDQPAKSLPAAARPVGELGVLPPGPWTCELPGDATVVATPQPAESFRTLPDSSYAVAGRGSGTYLRLGQNVTMTTGPFAGNRYRLDGETRMHRLAADGSAAPLRCVRAGIVPGPDRPAN